MNLIALLGPTSSGKSDLAVNIALKLHNCVIVSCDSRQIYRGLNIGTGKVDGTWEYRQGKPVFVYRDVTHYLIDYVDVSTPYSVAEYINDWLQLPFFDEKNTSKPEWIILVGGTGLWAKAILENYQLTSYNHTVRAHLINVYKTKHLSELQHMYIQHNLPRLNNAEFNNPRRLINKLANAHSKLLDAPPTLYPPFKSTYVFALDIKPHILQDRIRHRLHQRLSAGLLQEVESFMHLNNRLLELGLEYRITYLYLLGLYTEHEWRAALLRANINYAKRQLTWLRNQDATWIPYDIDPDNIIKTIHVL